MDRELSSYVEQMMTMVIMAAVVGLSATLIFLGQGYLDSSYEYVDKGTSHIRDDSFEKKYHKFVLESQTYPVASIVHEFNQMEDVVYNVRYATARAGYPKTLQPKQAEEYYHLRSTIKNTTSQDATTGLVTVYLVLE